MGVWRSLRLFVRLLLIGAIATGVNGCGKDKIDTSQLKATWESYQSKHFTFYFPADSPRAARIAMLASECEDILVHVTRVLQLEPDRMIDFFAFTTDAQGDSILHRPLGFFADGQVFWRIGQPPGGMIALAGCSLIDPQAPSFLVLKTGMYQLYAQPSINVHARTFGFERQNRFIPLTELAKADTPRDQAVYEAESASLCAYLLARYGPERFKMLWRSVLGLSDSLEKIYRLEIGRIEEDWRGYFRREAART